MSTEIDRLLENANDFFYKNDYDNAAALYEAILKKDATHIASMQKLAKIENSRGNRNKACDYYTRSLELQPKDVNTLNDLGNIYYDMKDYDRAVESYKKAIEIQPEYYWAHFNIGLSIRQKYPGDEKKNNEAKEWFEKTLALNDEYYPAYNEIGLYYLEKEELNKADAAFHNAMKIFPSYKFPYFNCALIEKKRGDTAKAREYLMKAVELDQGYVAALNNLGILYYDEKDYQTALYYYARALEHDDEYLFALYNLGLVFSSIEEYRKAHDMFAKALKIDQSYIPAKDEMERLKEKYSDEIARQTPITAKDLKSATYKKNASIPAKKEHEEQLNSDAAQKGEPVAEKLEKEEEFYTQKFGRNVTALAREHKLFDVLGREKEIQSVMEVLLKIKKNNPLIVGRAGVGKTAIIEGMAAKIISGDVPDFFKDKEILEINMGMLVAGTQFRGDFEKRLQRIIDEVTANEKIILFVDEIHTVLGAGETTDSSLDAANILKPALARGELRLIGATTTEEYNKYFVKDSAFQRRFYPIHVDELDYDSTLRILKNLKSKMSSHYKIEIPEKILDLIVTLANDEIKNRVFPDKAIDVLENSCSRCIFEKKTVLDEYTVKRIVGEFIGAKFLEAEDDRGQRLMEIESSMKKKIYGQNDAIDRVCKIIRLTKQKLDLKPEQPDGVFLFIGPSGVGKTYLAKQLSQFLYGSEEKLINLNMAEFTEPHSVSKLIGSPPGYVGYDEVPIFSKEILENPSCLLLLDEVEKAHPEVLKLFLEIFDEGKAKDTKGREIFFSNVTIVMTSNAGCKAEAGIGFDMEGEGIKADVDLSSTFPVEFLNRIDEIICFNYIDKSTAKKILKNLIVKRAEKTFAKKGIEVEFDPLFIEFVLERGYSKKYGVRNLERMFEKEVMSAAASFIFENPENKKLLVSAEGGKVKVL
ncbi:MAG: AAA family ATPase [Spirochaetales bacterium]|nr:AAA family ATPase [Spirochaetales bacterium]